MRVRRVGAQARARLLHGDTHFPDKALSIFEPHAEAIRKGNAAKADRVRQGREDPRGRGQDPSLTITWCATRMPDEALWRPALECQHSIRPSAPTGRRRRPFPEEPKKKA